MAETDAGTTPYSLISDPNTDQLLVGDVAAQEVLFLSSTPLSVVDRISLGSSPWFLCIDRVSHTLFTLDLDSGDLEALDVLSRRRLGRIHLGGGPVDCAVTADGARVVVVQQNDDQVAIVDTRSLTASSHLPVGNAPLHVAILGERAYVTNGADGTLSEVDPSVPATLRTIPVPLQIPPPWSSASSAIHIAASGDPRVAYVSQTADYGDQSTLAVVALNIETGEIEAATPTQASAIPFGFPLGLALSPDNADLFVLANGRGLSRTGYVYILSSRNLRVRQTIGLNERSTGLALTSTTSPAGDGCQMTPLPFHSGLYAIVLSGLPLLLFRVARSRVGRRN